VKTENPSACGTVNWKTVKNSDSAVLPVVPNSVNVQGAINLIIQSKTLLTVTNTCDNIYIILTNYRTWMSNTRYDIDTVTCYLRSQPIRGLLLGNSFVNTQQYWSRF
jgi:hypothetical protein